MWLNESPRIPSSIQTRASQSGARGNPLNDVIFRPAVAPRRAADMGQANYGGKSVGRISFRLRLRAHTFKTPQFPN